jgi:hypothetical protein
MLKQMRFVVLLLFGGLLPIPLAGQTTQTVDEIVQTAVVLSADEASLSLELADGRSRQVQLLDGTVYVDGREAASYRPGGALETAWRDFLRGASEGEFTDALTGFVGAETEADEAALASILEALAPLSREVSAEVAATVAPGESIAAAGDWASTVAEAASTVAAAAASAQLATEVATQEEVVGGGLVVELSNLEGLATSLGRIGLAPGLARVLETDHDSPVRIVLEADEYMLPEGAELDHTLILVETDGVLAGTVTGNVLVADGSLLITPTGRVEGEVVAIDANVQNQGTVVGGLRDAGQFAPVVVPHVAPRVRIRGGPPSVVSNLWSGLGSLARTVAMYLLFGFLGAIIVYFFRGQLETVSDTVSYSFGRSFLAGLAAEILFLPVGLVLTVLIVTAIAVPFYVLAFGLLGLMGYIGVAHAAGDNLTRHRFTWPNRLRRSNSYYYVLNGLGVLLALFVGAAMTQMAYPLLGWAHDLLVAAAWILTWVAATSGLGAALLSRAGTRRTYARPGQLPELPFDSRAEHRAPFAARARNRPRAEEMGDEI